MKPSLQNFTQRIVAILRMLTGVKEPTLIPVPLPDLRLNNIQTAPSRSRSSLSSYIAVSLAAILSLGLGHRSQAQVSNYVFAATTGTYASQQSGGTTIYASGWDDDAIAGAVTLPFSFTFNGTSFSTIRVSPNGYITFGTTVPTTTGYTAISATTGYSGAIAALSKDLADQSGGANAIVTNTIGTTPNRKFYIEWTGARAYNGNTALTASSSFQIVLNETSNIININYGTVTPGGTTWSPSPQVGLRGTSNTDFKNLTGTNWAAPTAGSTNTSAMTMSSANFPASGQIYTFAPRFTLAATSLTAFGNVCVASTAGPNSFTINGYGLSTANVTVGALANYTYSTTANGTYTNSLSLTQAGGTYTQQIFVKFTPPSAATSSGNIAVGGGGAISRNVAASGTGVAPAVGGSVSGAATVCSGTNSTTLTLSGHTGSVTRWESSLDNFATAGTAIANTTTSLTATNLTATTSYRAVLTSGACSPANSASVTVTVNPTPLGGSVAGAAAVCSGTNSTTLTLSGYTGSVIRWESSLDNFATAGTTIANTTTSLTATDLTATTSYRAVLTNGTCTANSTSATVTVNPLPVNRTVAAATSTICSGSSTNITVASSSSTTTYQLRNNTGDVNIGTAVTGTSGTISLPTGNLTANTTFNVLATFTATGCSLQMTTTPTITVSATATPAAAGADQTNCNSGVFTLAGNTPSVGTGLWTVTSGTATITTNTSPTSGVTAIAAGASATLTWTITNGACTSSDAIILTNNALPSAANAGVDKTNCNSGSFTMTATAPTTGTGLWTLVSGTASITSVTLRTSGITGVSAGSSATLRWTVSNGTCPATTDDVILTNIVASTVPNAGADQTNCNISNFTLAGNAITQGVGSWSVVSGTASITDPSSPTSEVTGVPAGTSATLRWTNTNTPCAVLTDDVLLTNNDQPSITGITICQGGSGSLSSSFSCPSGGTFNSSEFTGTGTNVTTIGSRAWTNTGNILTDNGTNASVSVSNGGTVAATSNYLQGTNFGFSIPATAVIEGIRVTINRSSTLNNGTNNVQDDQVRLVKAGTVLGDNKAIGGNWSTTTTTAPVYGTASDLWNTTWTPAEINASNFGVALAVDINRTNGNTVTASVDYISVAITYTIPGILDWYTVSSGGTPIGSGSSFDPVGVANSGLVNTNTPGTTTFYAECSTVPGCRTQTDFIINPSSAIASITDEICSGAAFTVTPVDGVNGVVPVGTTYSWPSPAISGSLTGAASGSGEINISSTGLTNTGNTPATATYTVTPVTGSCTGPAFTVTVTVNPKPAITDITDAECSGNTFTVTPANGTNGVVPSGTTYSWSIPTVTGGLLGAEAGSGSGISGTLINIGSTPETATYTVAPVSGAGCAGASFTVTVTVNPNPANPTITPFSLSPLEICEGSSVVLASSASAGNQWYKNGLPISGETTATYTATTTGSYTVVVTLLGCVSDFSAETQVSVQTNQWTSTGVSPQDRDWNNGANWSCGTPPAGGTSVVISATASVFPQLPTGVDPVVNNLTLPSGASIEIQNQILTINGTITGTGTLTGSNTSSLVIGGSALGQQLNFTTGGTNNFLKSLTINSGASATLGNALNITSYDGVSAAGTGEGVVTVAGTGVLTTGGNLTIKSGEFGTARIAPNLTSSSYISGAVTVERFIPVNATRAYRLLTAPTSGQTIKQSWQEGQAATTVGTNNLGTQITGNFSNTAAAQALGFDEYTPGTSMFSYNPVTNAFDRVDNTNTKQIDSVPGWLVYIRGDRRDGKSVSTIHETTLRTSGTIKMGTQGSASVVAGKYAVVANPYASAIDLTKLTMTGGVEGGVITVWDPKIGTTGGYVNLTPVGSPVVTGYIASPAANGYSSYNSTIQSGQAFFVQAGSSDGTVTIGEDSKVGGSTRQVFRPATPSAVQQHFFADLYSKTATSKTILDGVFISLDEANSNDIDNFDGRKQNNFVENLGMKLQGVNLAVEKRKPFTATDTVFFNTTSLRKTTYQLAFKTENLDANLVAMLEDRYLNTKTLVNPNGTSTYDFTVDANAASSAADRFRVVFKEIGAGTLPVTFVSIKAAQQNNNIAVEWKVGSQLNIAGYDVERSADGRNFTKMATVAASNTALYNWLDVNAPQGINFYRIKATDLSGEFRYTTVVKVNITKSGATITASPNPVTGNNFTLQFTNQPAGQYKVSLFSAAGQLMYSNSIQHNGGSLTQSVNLKNSVVSGVYELQITQPGKAIHSQKLIVDRK